MAVSRLSAALRRRVISEEEVVRAVLAEHSFNRVAPFISEVFWRTYWKGWLESRPDLWPQLQQDVEVLKTETAKDAAIGAQYRAACAGQTGIMAFDHWARELAETGYLHNWSRMQVASIWVFTLGLPWQLGADWMFSHLIDADPASNTLSWRWVAGLHTAGKNYLADSERIFAMTDGALTAEGLATVAVPPTLPPPTPMVERRMPVSPHQDMPSLLLLTCEDMSLEKELLLNEVRGIVIPIDLIRAAADQMAMEDTACRAVARWPGCSVERLALQDVPSLALSQRCDQVVTGFLPIGPTKDQMIGLQSALSSQNIVFAEHQRQWDILAWPFCNKGFFHLKSKIQALLQLHGIP